MKCLWPNTQSPSEGPPVFSVRNLSNYRREAWAEAEKWNKNRREEAGGAFLSTRLSLSLSYHALHSFFISTGTWPWASDLTGVLWGDGSLLTFQAANKRLWRGISLTQRSANFQRQIFSLNAATIHECVWSSTAIGEGVCHSSCTLQEHNHTAIITHGLRGAGTHRNTREHTERRPGRNSPGMGGPLSPTVFKDY